MPARPRPDLILLDLNLPKKDGREVLAEIKQDEDLKRIPVVVVTTSGAEEDVVRTLQPARECLCHQAGRPEAVPARSSDTIEEFWLAVVTLPPTGKAR